MKKCIVIPDSFKGTMSSAEVCTIMRDEIVRFYPECKVIALPVADGGEGSVDAFLAAIGGEKASVAVKNPFFEDMESFYGILKDGRTAVIEMAACAGLPLSEGRLDPEKTTTYGVGQLMADAVQRGCDRIILGLGGSATNDGGCGAAAALGVIFKRADGTAFIPVGGTLSEIASIEIPHRFLENITVTAMCDIDNPFYGPQGAACIFAPQKGADEGSVRRLDAGLRHLADIVAKAVKIDLQKLPGSGAAGGMGGGAAAFFNATLKMGIDVVLDTVNFDELLVGTDMVFSGEGRIDSQTVRGKVVAGVAQRTQKKSIPLIAVVGDIGDGVEMLYDRGVSAIVSINRVAKPFSEIRGRSPQDLRLTMQTVLHLLKLKG